MTIESEERLGSWMYNVIDEYKPLSTEEIKLKVKEKSLGFAVMMSQIHGDFNFSSVIRSANALGASEVFYHGKRRFDRRGALGTYHYTDVTHLTCVEEIKALKEKYRFVGLENNIDRACQNLKDYKWAKNSLIILGEEGCGLTDEILDLCDDYVFIEQRGSVRSINAAVASSVAMYDYTAKV